MNYQHELNYYEWKYQQSCRNWTIYEWCSYYEFDRYDFREVERLKDMIARNGSLRVNDGACESLVFEPDYAEYSGEMEPEESAALQEMQAEYFRNIGTKIRETRANGVEQLKIRKLELKEMKEMKMKLRQIYE